MGFCEGEEFGHGGHQPLHGPWTCFTRLQNTSNDIILDFLNGTTKTFPNSCIGCVGVKGVAMAHILAYESATPTGRYICAKQLLHYADLVALLSKLYPTYPISAK
jgi:hypothetical protein